MKESFTIAQISDLHVGREIQFPSMHLDLFDELVHTANKISEMEPLPDILIVTGDLANHASERDYRRVKTVLDNLPISYYIVVGNHDSRNSLRDIFPEHKYLQSNDPFIQYTVDYRALRIVALDTLCVDSHRGLIDDQRLYWLDKKLAK